MIELYAVIGKGSNDELVEFLASHARCRVGGGVRSAERARKLVDQGAHRIIVGTAAFSSNGPNYPFLKKIASAVGPERILLALDSKEGKVVVKGWRESTDFTAEGIVG